MRMRAITPELAANVVRDFILPMFENDGKKFIKKKNRKALSKIQNQSVNHNRSLPD